MGAARIAPPPSGDVWLRLENAHRLLLNRLVSRSEHILALIAEKQGTTEHTETTERWHNGGRICFRGFVGLCG